MALHRENGGSEPIRPEPAERLIGHHEKRPAAGAWHLATGTLACPSCDAPTAPPHRALAPADPMGCGYCGREGAVRDFLSLSEPARPTRVAVRVRGLALR